MQRVCSFVQTDLISRSWLSCGLKLNKATQVLSVRMSFCSWLCSSQTTKTNRNTQTDLIFKEFNCPFSRTCILKYPFGIHEQQEKSLFTVHWQTEEPLQLLCNLFPLIQRQHEWERQDQLFMNAQEVKKRTGLWAERKFSEKCQYNQQGYKMLFTPAQETGG